MDHETIFSHDDQNGVLTVEFRDMTSWHYMFSASLATYVVNIPFTGDFPAQKPVIQFLHDYLIVSMGKI